MLPPEAWYEFVTENYNKVSIDNIAAHNLNLIKVNEWSKRIKQQYPNDKCMQIFSDTIREKITHISASEFHHALISIVNYLRNPDDTEAPHLSNKCYLYIPSTIDKSQTWVSILITPILTKYDIEIAGVLGADDTYNACNSCFDDNIPIITCDDMSYTGTQLSLNLKTLIDKFGRRPISSNKILVVIPYITKDATKMMYTMFKSLLDSDQMFFATRAVFDNLKSQLIEKAGDNKECADIFQNNNTKYSVPFDYFGGGHQCVVYFDHKFADSVSIPAKLLWSGCLNEQDSNKIGSFFDCNDCNLPNVQCNAKNAINVDAWTPIYKDLNKYTFRGNKVTSVWMINARHN